MPIPKISAALALGVLILSATACGPGVELNKEIAIVDVTSGWFDAGIIKDPEGEKNRIIPTIAFRLKNVTENKTIDSVQINAVYRQVNDREKEWGTSWVKGIGTEGLKPGQSSDRLVLRSDRGYTGLEPRMQMLNNSSFVDVVVDIMGKYRANQWVRLGSFQIARQLLTR